MTNLSSKRLHDVLFLVEGFTDIRFVAGLCRICRLTMVVPQKHYASSGLKARVKENGCQLEVVEIPGNRLAFQWRSFWWLWRNATSFDVILSQEVLRGSLSATLVGRMKEVPVVPFLATSPVEYFRCRKERGQIGIFRWLLGSGVIRALMSINGKMATAWLALPGVLETARRHCSKSGVGLYYGVDTDRFSPASDTERTTLRSSLGLPQDRFIALFPSRISHEKDPETVLLACDRARRLGLDLCVLNLGGGYREFMEIAERLFGSEAHEWVLGRPAVHPIDELSDYVKCVDVVLQASLAEAQAISTLEGLACGVPVIATAVGGMSTLEGHAQLVARKDFEAMATKLLWVSNNVGEARIQALRGRQHVEREWNSTKAFADLFQAFEEVTG